MDVLDDILSTMDLRGALYFRTDFSGAWGATVPNLANAARFHLVIQGQCHVRIVDGPNYVLSAGDIILIPRGRSHVLSKSETDDAPPLETVLSESNYDGQGVLAVGNGDNSASTQLVCGHFSFRPGSDHPLLRALPDALVVTNADRVQYAWLDELLRLLARNVFSNALGSHGTIVRLSEIVFMELLRAGVEDRPELEAIFAAFSDKMIGRSLELMHQNVAEQWTIAKLASTVGMSRSRFAERFKEMVGTGPMTYLTEWRLQKSLAMLNHNRTTVARVAVKSGYQSSAAFSRAFSSRFGVTPSNYRRDDTGIASTLG